MTSTELAVVTEPRDGLHAQMDYARAVQSASMLPEAYRGKPADIMLAVGLGQSMGLSPAESLYRINVIKGKPTASAELIAANVRKAGHRLRVVTDAVPSATATIIRSDDPEFEFVVTRDADWARSMGLADQPNYRKQPETMLQWRAITACARLACPEALYGVVYTPDEVDWSDGRTVAPAASGSAADRMRAALADDGPRYEQPPQTSGPDGAPAAPPLPSDPEPESPLLNTSSALAKRMYATFNEAGITDRDDRLRYVSDVLGREVASSAEMTDADASQVIDALAADLAADPDADYVAAVTGDGA